MPRIAVSIVCACLTSTLGFAQNKPDFEALDKQLKFKVEDDGQILMSPNPASARWDFTPLVDPTFGEVLANGGVMTWLVMVSPGGVDFASLADGETVLRRLGRSEDAHLFQAIGSKATEGHERLLRMLAIDVARRRGLKPALGPLQKVVAEADTDRWTRRAAREAVASLRGEPTPDFVEQLDSLAGVLAEAPASASAAFVIDYRHLPNTRGLLALGREVGTAVTKREILSAGGSVSPFAWAGAVKLAEGPAAMPYDIARRFGNFRIDRLVSVVCADSLTTQEPNGWVHVDGLFEPKHLAKGLVDFGIEAKEDGDAITFEFNGLGVRVAPTSIRASLHEDEEPLGAERAAKLAAPLQHEGAGVRFAWGDHVETPEIMSGWPSPRTVAVWVPHGDSDVLRAVATGIQGPVANLVAGQIGGLPRMIETWLDDLDDPEPFDDFLDALDTLKFENEKGTMELEISFEGVDFHKMFRDAALSGNL